MLMMMVMMMMVVMAVVIKVNRKPSLQQLTKDQDFFPSENRISAKQLVQTVCEITTNYDSRQKIKNPTEFFFYAPAILFWTHKFIF